MMRRWPGAVAIAGALVLMGGCAMTPTASERAWTNCVHGHGPRAMQVDDGVGGTVMQGAEESCARWLDTVGADAFEHQWTEEYALMYRCSFYVWATATPADEPSREDHVACETLSRIG